MPRRGLITQDLAELILEAFRERPGNASAAARASDCDPRTCKKAWYHGLRTCPDPQYHRPFRDILADEQVEIRARLAKEEAAASNLTVQTEASRRQDAHERALEDITKQRSQEEHLVRGARAATIVLMNNVTSMAAGATALGQKVRVTLETFATDGVDLTIGQAKDVVSLVGRLSTSLRQLNEAGQKAMEMSRLLAGEPTHIVGVQHLTAIPMHEAKDRVQAAQRAIAELEAEGATAIGDTNMHH